jgi:type IV pilus assembly protein PilO
MSLRDPRLQKILILVVVSATILWGYFLTDILDIRELRTEYESVSAEVEKARRMVGNLPRLEREHAELERRWSEAQELLPTDNEAAKLLTQVTQSGQQAGVHFERFKPAAAKPLEFYNENSVEVQVTAGYHQFGIFLSRLANLSRLVNVSNLALTGFDDKHRDEADEAGRGDHTLTANFVATAYSLRDPSLSPNDVPPAEKSGARKLKAKRAPRRAGGEH